jgi:tripartite-type tricarboxylate transporter receptor subunit TctC
MRLRRKWNDRREDIMKSKREGTQMKWVLQLKTALIFILAFSVIGLSLFLQVAEAQQYPNQPINITVPWNAGSSTDLVPRVVAPYLSKAFGVAVNVINKPGGSGVTGTYEALRAKPDGYSMLADGVPVSVHIGVWKDLPFDPKNRTFIARMVVQPFTIIVKADSPWKTIADVEREVRKNPKSFRWSWLGGGGGVDIVTAQIKAEFVKKGVDLSETKTVTFTGTAAVMPAVGGGHVDIAVGTRASVSPMVSAGKARLIGISGPDRYKGYPEIPSAAEQGYPGINVGYWVGFFGPPNLPPEIVKAWQKHTKAIVNDPELLPKWDDLGAVPAYLEGDAFKAFVLKEADVIHAIMPNTSK